MKLPNTREGNVEVTDSAVILHGLNRFQPSTTILLSAIQAVDLTQPPSWKIPPSFEIRTADGRVIKRTAINGRAKIVEQFMSEAYEPVLNAVTARAGQ